MTETIGSILKSQRKAINQSQIQVATNICSQSMLSAIENDHYTPNAQLLIALCKRLKISLDTISLATNYAISVSQPLNDKLAALCNQHQYKALLAFLLDEQVIQSVDDDAQTQSYYYYLGVAQLQATSEPDLATVNRTLQLSLASATPRQTALTRLTQATLACIAAKANHSDVALVTCEAALDKIESDPYDENLNIVFYLVALAHHLLGNEQMAFTTVLNGIEFTTSHESHYMLANSYYLIATIAERLGQADKRTEAAARSTFLAGLFNEQVYKI
ncbi:helix-turn-helix domain-containing protein [Agrilactobacillus yilanensis]|uniref:Helix-turn-helix domain-containing protein n=1 Tax=Agrilactobacillus yilanensis TaxID=2485997 RepID=A0ABW4JBR0_9LACO|nr:helix-turn-helix transcriptional regulator [Agrilactobacillus yilanensis]